VFTIFSSWLLKVTLICLHNGLVTDIMTRHALCNNDVGVCQYTHDDSRKISVRQAENPGLYVASILLLQCTATPFVSERQTMAITTVHMP